MSEKSVRRTWDGQPISPVPPFGATVVVYRRTPELAILLLHRAHHGLGYEGDWAWTPPAGSRQPGESIAEAARRELHEEAGLCLPLTPLPCSTADWFVYLAEIGDRDTVTLIDPEHDRFIWLSAAKALARVAPDVVRKTLGCALSSIDTH